MSEQGAEHNAKVFYAFAQTVVVSGVGTSACWAIVKPIETRLGLS